MKAVFWYTRFIPLFVSQTPWQAVHEQFLRVSSLFVPLCLFVAALFELIESKSLGRIFYRTRDTFVLGAQF